MAIFTFRLTILLYLFFVILHFQFYRFVELAIRQCKSSGIDCKVHGLTMVGRMRTDEDDLAATFTFLASDNEEDEEERTSTQVSEWVESWFYVVLCLYNFSLIFK